MKTAFHSCRLPFHLSLHLVRAGFLGLAAAAHLLLCPYSQAVEATTTIKNLNTAFQGESNAAHRYAEFAKKADEEGYPQVAKLFRAAAFSESIHRDTHRAAIEKLGGTAEPVQLDPPAVGTTAENLRAAVRGENYEIHVMYPEFLTEAKKEDKREAIRAFEFAIAGEKEHAKLYQLALDTLGKNAPVDYYVCKTCGMTLTELPEKKCPVCRKGREEYRKMS